MARKSTLLLSEFEQNVIINSLLEWKNNRTSEGKVTDGIDEVLLKFLKAPAGKVLIK